MHAIVKVVAPLGFNSCPICTQCAQLPGFMQDEAAQRFLSQSLPLCFEKLYDANEVFNKWPNSVIEEARASQLRWQPANYYRRAS